MVHGIWDIGLNLIGISGGISYKHAILPVDIAIIVINLIQRSIQLFVRFFTI